MNRPFHDEVEDDAADAGVPAPPQVVPGAGEDGAGEERYVVREMGDEPEELQSPVGAGHAADGKNGDSKEGESRCSVCAEKYDEACLMAVLPYPGASTEEAELLCENCMTQTSEQCDTCGNIYDKSALAELGIGKWVCTACAIEAAKEIKVGHIVRVWPPFSNSVVSSALGVVTDIIDESGFPPTIRVATHGTSTAYPAHKVFREVQNE